MKTLRRHRTSLGYLMTALMLTSSLQVSGANADWGVTQGGLPGTFSWQHLYNWNAVGQHLNPATIPNAASEIANLNVVNLLGNQTINLNGAVTLGTLNIGDTIGQQSYTLAAGTGGALTLNNGGTAQINKTGLGWDLISSGITLANNTNIDVSSSGALRLSGIIGGTGTGITKTGIGTLILSGANTYTGANTVSAGMLVGAVNAALGTTAGNTTIASGAALGLLSSTAALTIGDALNVQGTGINGTGAIRNLGGAGTNALSGAITFAGSTMIRTEAGDFRLTGVSAISNPLKFTGVGQSIIQAAVTGSAAITKDGMGTHHFNTATIPWSGTYTANLGTTIASNNNSSMGAVSALNVKNGLLQIVMPNNATATDAANSRVNNAAPISMGSSRLFLEITGTNGNFNTAETVGDVTLLRGFSSIDVEAPNATFTNALTLNSLTRNTGAAMFFAGTNLGTAAAGGKVLLPSAPTLDGGGLVGGWAVFGSQFVTYGANGFTANTVENTGAEGTYVAASNVSVTGGGITLTANRTINALRMADTTGRTLNLGGFTATINSGGIVTAGGNVTQTISNGTLMPATTTGELFLHGQNGLNISAIIADNGGTPTSIIKTGTGTTTLLSANTYSGTTYITEGQLRVNPYVGFNPLNNTNINFSGHLANQAVFETAGDYTYSLGTAAGQVQFTGGQGVGFGAIGPSAKINFGGAGATVTWGSAAFDPGMFTLSGGNGYGATRLINPIDLAGEQRYFRIDGGASGSIPASVSVIQGDLSNGGIALRGGGMLVLDSAKSYSAGTSIQGGILWLRGNGTAGSNSIANDIYVFPGAALRVDAPSNIGSNQRIILNNQDANSPAVIAFGAGYGDLSGVSFSSGTTTNGVFNGAQGSGGNSVYITQANANRVAIQLDGTNTGLDVIGQINAVNNLAQTWLGATGRNGMFTGSTLSPSVGNYRLGSGIGTLTITGTNVLTGGSGLIVGSSDTTARSGLGGTVYLPNAQNFSGTVTLGSGGILQVNTNAALGTNTGAITMAAGELRVDPVSGLWGGADTQYAARNFNLTGNSVFRATSLFGGSNNAVTLGNVTLNGADRVLTVSNIGTSFNDVRFGTVTLTHTAAANQFFDIGGDNTGQNSIATITGVMSNGGAGAISLQKRNAGVLILNSDNTYNGSTNTQQGRLVLANLGAAGNAASAITFNTNNDRRSDIEFRQDGTGPFVFNNTVATSGGNDGSVRVLTVGPIAAGSVNQEVQVNSLSLASGGTWTVGIGGGSTLFFDGSAGYRFNVTGATTLTKDFTLRPRGALVTLSGPVSGLFGLEKHEQGTLVLNGANTYGATTGFASSTGLTTLLANPATIISNGYLVAGHDNALSTGPVVIRNNAFSQLLASGVRTIGNSIENIATGSTQTVGGLDAGAKTFSGGIVLNSRGVNLTAITGGDVTFTGTISQGASALGIAKDGNGTVILSPASGTGNTFAGAVTINGGTLQGQAQATSGSPFGVNGAFNVNNGTLKLQGLAAPVANSNTVTTGALNFSDFSGGRVVVNDVAADTFQTQFTFGSLSNTNNNVVTFIGERTGFGATVGEERITFTSAPAVANGTIGTFAVIAGGGSNAGHYASISGNDLVTATYVGAPADLDGSTVATNLWDATGFGGTLTANRATYGVRTDSAIALGGNVLNLGTGGNAGLILNNGADISGAGSVNFGTNYLSLYVDNAATSTLSSTLTNYRNNSNNTLGTVFSKFGPGTLEISSPLTFEGNMRVVEGTLSLTAANVLPMFENQSARTGSIVVIRPNGTILLNGNNQEFGNLSGGNQGGAFQFSGGVLNFGSADVIIGRLGTDSTYSGQLIGGSGSSLTKVGAGRLTLDNYNGNMPNSLETLIVDQGILTSWNNDQSWSTPSAFASSIPSSTNVILRGGEWEVRAIGDSTGNQQRIAIGNNITVTGGNSILDTDRATGSGSNKLLTFGSLTLSGPQQFLATGGNTFLARFNGNLNLATHSRIQTDGALGLAGSIVGNHTLEKRGGSSLEIGANNSAWSGGLVITDGTVLFGNRGTDDIRYQGTTFVPSSTANAGTGDIVVNRNSAIRFNAPSNVLTGSGQLVQIFGSGVANSARAELGTDAALTAYGLRSIMNVGVSLATQEGLWTNTIDQSRIGDGNSMLSAVSNTYYTAPTLGAGVDNVYRFGGTNAGVISIVNANALNASSSLVVGRSHVLAGGNPGSSTAYLRLYEAQSYTGLTSILRGADAGSIGNTLEITGPSNATSAYDVFGRLILRGSGRLTNDAGAQSNTVNLYPGSMIRLDYRMDVNDSLVIARQTANNQGMDYQDNKLSDTATLLLNGATLELANHDGRVNAETTGPLQIRGGSGVRLERTGTNGQMVLFADSLVRSGQGTFAIRENANELGSTSLQSMKMFVTGTPVTITNGIAPAWMTNQSRQTFLGYGTTGFVNAAYVNGTPTAAGGDAFLTPFTGTEVVQFQAGWGDTTLTGTRNVYALRVNHVAANDDMTFTGGQINIHGGGLIIDNRDNARVNFDTTAVYFGNGSAPVEGVIWTDENTARFGGVVTANNLTINGSGNVQLTSLANVISGTIELQGSQLFLDGNGTRGTAGTINLTGSNLGNNNGSQMPVLNLRHNGSVTEIYTGLVVNVAADLPVATITSGRYGGSGTTTQVQFGSLNIAGTNTLQGTFLNLNNSNANVTVLNDNTWGGTAPIALSVGSNTWQFAGNITSSAPITKWGTGVLRLDSVNRDATFTSPITLNAGELRIQGIAAGGVSTAEGTGALIINGGTLRLASANTGANTTGTYYSSAGQHITVAGNAVIGYDRNGGTPGTNSNVATIGAAGLEFRTVNSPIVTIDALSNFGDGLRLASELVLRDQPFFRIPDHNFFINNIVRGNGTLTRGDSYLITFNNNAANPNWSGGFTALQGYSRVTQANTNFTFGTGPVVVGPTAGISLNSLTNIAGGAVAQFSSGYTTPVMLGVSQATLVSAANLNALFPSANNTSRAGAGGILGLDAVTTSTAINLGTFLDGYWFLGGNVGGSTYTGDAGSLTIGAGNVWRLGAAGGITIDPTTAGSTLFTGTGSQLQVGKPDAWHSAGYNASIVTFANDLNSSYTGGTTISRGRDIGGGWYQAGLVVNGGNPTATTYRTPLGTGPVDVYGHIRFATANGGLVDAAGVNYANIVTHTGGRVTFDNRTAFINAAAEGRYDNQAGLVLNGAALHIRGTNNVNTIATNREDIGELTIERGAHIRVGREGTGFAGLGISALTRGTNGTLTINHTAALLGANTAAGGVNNTEVVFVTGGGSIPMTNGMVAPWVLSRQADQFLRYDATNGLRLVSDAGAPTEYVNVAAATTTIDSTVLTTNDGTRIFDLGAATGTQTLGMNPDVYALRLARNLNQSADGAFSNVTIRSGGLIFLANSPVINANLDFGVGGASEALIYTAQSTGAINGQIRASQVTKFGRGFLNITSDQPLMSSTTKWVVNEGGIQFLTPGSVGSSTSEIVLNGSTMSDDDDRRDGGASIISTELRYNYNSGSPEQFVWNHGKITAYDHNVIRMVPQAGGTTQNDRNQLIPAIDLRTTNTTPGTNLHPGLIRFQVDGSRSTLTTGAVTLFDNYVISAESSSFGPGAAAAIQLGALSNAGAYDITKIGDGMLALGDNSAGFTGNRFFYADEGGVRALHNGSFGAAGNTAVFSQGSSLEIAVAGFTPLATLDQRPGSFERWAVDGARSGTYTLPTGVSLQVFANQTGTQTININGGSIMGYLPLDWDHVATINTLGSGVTINLTGNSFLGQNVQGGGQTVIYDMGKENSWNGGGNPNDPALRGSYLQIDGAITGTGNLTKVGRDVILINGANTYSGITTVKNGILQIGRNNGLPSATSLVMDGSSGIFDLNGYNQEVAVLSGSAGSINNGRFDFNTLTVNQASNTSYSGTFDGNVTLLKKGAGTLTLSPVSATGNTTTGSAYRGGTILEAGKLGVSMDLALGQAPNTADAANVRFTGGTLLANASFTTHVNRGITLDNAGGTIEVAPTFTAQIGGIATGSGALTKTGTGVLQVNNAANNYTGATNVQAGVLRGGSLDALAPTSRHIITGDAVSGSLSVNGLNQTIGSLASTGASQGSAAVTFTGTEILTVGGDSTQDAVYAGAINGGGTLRVSGNGAVQTLSTVDNSTQTWSTQIANGQLVVANGAKLGSGSVDIGVAGVSGIDDRAALVLQGVTGFANNITVNTANSTGSTFITAAGASNSSITGTVAAGRDIFTGAAAGQQLSFENAVSGAGRLTVVDGGSVRLTVANTFGTGVTGASGTAVDGGTIVRAGTVLLENSAAAGTKHIELGDLTSSIGAAVDRATFNSILGSGTWNPNGDGVSATSGGQDAAATTGNGAFIGVSSTVDGNTYGAGDVGKTILVAGEEANPERNGIYTIVSVSGGTMNLVRSNDYENANQMKYGGQVAVTNGTYSGKTMWMYEENIVVKNETDVEPIRFREDVVNPNIALLQNTSGLTVANNIDVNATSSGSITIGASSGVTTGVSTYSGTVQLQSLVGGAETKTVALTSDITGTNGVVFSGVISQANAGDTLSVSKVGSGTVTMSAVNTYSGTTSVTTGRLQVGDGTSGSITGTGAVSVTGAGTTLATAPVLAGGSATTVIAGAVTIGTATNPGILAPGLVNSATSNQQMSFSNAAGITVANGSQVQMSISNPTLDITNGTVSAWLASGDSLNTYLTNNPGAIPTLNVAPGAYGDMDYINLSAGTLSLGTRASGAFGDGSLVIQDNGWLSGAAAGDVFNLFDWASAMTGTFSVATPTGGTGGINGDLDLPTLTGGLLWDLSALASHGIIAVAAVPEPSRALFVLFGLMALFFRRRRD